MLFITICQFKVFVYKYINIHFGVEGISCNLEVKIKFSFTVQNGG